MARMFNYMKDLKDLVFNKDKRTVLFNKLCKKGEKDLKFNFWKTNEN